MGRMEAVWRIGAFLWAIVAVLVLQIAIFLAIIFAIIDLVIQILRGEGWGTNNMLAEWARRFIEWPYNLLIFGLFGDGSFQWLP